MAAQLLIKAKHDRCGANKMHGLALHGHTKAGLDTLARMPTRRTEPRVKLH